MNGIGHAIVLARENDTPDRWGIGAPPFPAKQGLGLPAVGIPSPARRGGALKQFALAEREALEPTLSRNIIKLQITDNHILSKVQSKSKSF